MVEPEPKTINGKEYTYYECTQQQRKMERDIRALKREVNALEALGESTEEVQAKLKQKMAEYKDFSWKAGMKPKMNRLRVVNIGADGKKQKKKKAPSTKPKHPKIEFEKVSTIEEAKAYAKNVLGIALEDFDGKVNIDVANMFLDETRKIYEIFGDLQKGGYLNGIRVYPKKSDWVAAYSPAWREVWVKNVKSKSALAKMAKTAEEQHAFGFWSTSCKEAAIRHELGHAIQHMYTDKYIQNGVATGKLKAIEDLRKETMAECGGSSWTMRESREVMKRAGSKLSYYGLKDNGEFIAESIAEYMGGSPRPMAKKVVELLLTED